MKSDLRKVAEVLGVTVAGDATVAGWSVDTRTLERGDLFFALRGPNHDGHDWAAEALRKGAAGVVLERDLDLAGTVLRVSDTLGALQKLACWARSTWGGDVVGITGSAGKTTTKDAIAALLSVGVATAKTAGNLNNHVGVPLSLLRVPEDARVAVIELGMNHSGEIRALARMAKPQVAVITSVGWAHMESFDSLDAVAAAKRELVEELPASGTAVLNADDPRVAAFREVHAGRTVTYGFAGHADVRAEDVECSRDGARFRVGGVQFATSLLGRHNVRNILAGVAVAGLYGIAPERLPEAVRALQPGKMRGERLTHHGILVYNDCYNSNPDALRVMLELLRDTPARRRIAVLGEMLELGHWAEPLHREVGDYVAACGINVLVGIRGAARYMLDAVKRADQAVDAAYFFEDPAEAGEHVRKLAQPGDAVLFKGSRGTHVETALERFLG